MSPALVGVGPAHHRGRFSPLAARPENLVQAWHNKFAIEDALDRTAAARAKVSDANSFLDLAKANQLFVAGDKRTLEDGLKDVKAKVLLLPAESDLLLHPAYSRQVPEILKAQGKQVLYREIPGDGGHLDGVAAIGKVGALSRAEPRPRTFRARSGRGDQALDPVTVGLALLHRRANSCRKVTTNFS